MISFGVFLILGFIITAISELIMLLILSEKEYEFYQILSNDKSSFILIECEDDYYNTKLKNQMKRKFQDKFKKHKFIYKLIKFYMNDFLFENSYSIEELQELEDNFIKEFKNKYELKISNVIKKDNHT